MTEHIGHEAAIEMTAVTKSFGRKVAVDDVSLSIPRGTTFGFIGPNGAGKSTTIRILMGLLPMDSGTAKVLGIDAAADPQAVRPVVGYVPEQHFIYRWMRVRDVLRFCRSFYMTWNDALCEQLLEQFQLPAERKVKALSKGMLVKLALLLAVVHEPRLLILDEPTSGLDPLVREEFLDGVLRTICGEDRTVLFSSHTLGDVHQLADSVGIIHEGKLLAHCPVDELVSRTKRVRMVLEGKTPSPQVLKKGIHHQLHRRECVLTVPGFSTETVDELSGIDGVKIVEVLDMTLEEVFKDYIKGRRAMV